MNYRILRWIGAAAAALVLSACGGGGGGGDAPPAAATPPTVVIRAAATGTSAGTPLTLQTRLGATVSLDGSASTAGSGSVTAYAWTVTTRPAGSTAAPSAAATSKAAFVPDVTGEYVLSLKVTDGGGNAEATLRLTVDAPLPSPTLSTNVSFAGPSVTRPTQTVSLGSTITMDASGSADEASGAVTIGWTLLAKPTASTLALPATGSSVTLVLDAAGTYTVRARATTATGTVSDVLQSFEAVANAPAVAVATSVNSLQGTRRLGVAIGNMVALSADTPYYLNYTASWALDTKPGSSSVPALVTAGGTTSFVPDVPGVYVATANVKDGNTGLTVSYRVVVTADYGPTAVVSASGAPVATATVPSFVSSTGQPVTLRGGGSFDAAGGALTYKWRLVSSPLGSTAALTADTQATATFTPERAGSYLVELVVTNAAGIASTQQATVFVGSYPPVATVDRSRITVLAGQSARSSAAASYSLSGNTVSYSWSIDARPTGSTATIASANQAALDFVPDVAGTYTATVTVSDGSFTALSPVVITALAPSAGVMPLTYTPQLSRFSKTLGVAVIVSANPNELHLVDAEAGTDTVIALPATSRALALSPSGRVAAVLHDGRASLINLHSRTLVRSMNTGGLHTDVAVSDSGLLYLAGSSSGSFNNWNVIVIDGNTGVKVQELSSYFYYFYGPARLVLSDVQRKLFVFPDSGSGAFASITLDTAGSLLTLTSASTQSFAGSVGPWLNADQSLLFSPTGSYIGTTDLQWVNTLGGNVQALSSASGTGELLALPQPVPSFTYPVTTYVLSSTFRRYTGSLLFASGELPFPKVTGATSYGIALFHRADDKRVFIVQTGSSTQGSADAQYYVVLQ